MIDIIEELGLQPKADAHPGVIQVTKTFVVMGQVGVELVVLAQGVRHAVVEDGFLASDVAQVRAREPAVQLRVRLEVPAGR